MTTPTPDADVHKHYAAKKLTSQQKAALRAEEIRLGLQSTGVLYAQAVREKDWSTLHYESVGAWALGEFGPDRFCAERRQEIVKMLTQAGLTQRAIAAATNTSHQTIGRDQRRVAAQAAVDTTYDAFGESQEPPVESISVGPADDMPMPPRPQGNQRQVAARAREAERDRSRAVTQDHVHVWDRCACGAKTPTL